MSFLAGGAMFVIGVVVVLVGALVIRKAHPTSGYLFIAAGAVVILFRCCFGGAAPEMLIESGMDYDLIGIIMLLKTLFGAGHLLLVGILFAAGLVTLSKQISSDAG